MRAVSRVLFAAFLSSAVTAAAQNSGSSKSPCEESVTALTRIEKPGTDWSRGVVRKLRVVDRSAFGVGPGGEDGLVSVTYGVVGTTVLLPYISIKGCDNTAIVSDLYFRPSSAVGVERRGQIFAYVVSGRVMSSIKPDAAAIGAAMNVVFYDVHGHGHFDTVHIGSMKKLPFVPGWIR